eukprot:12428-Heterococcus_DN1.PRE.2
MKASCTVITIAAVAILQPRRCSAFTGPTFITKSNHVGSAPAAQSQRPGARRSWLTMSTSKSSVADEEEVDDFDLTELSLTDDEDVAQIRRRLLQQAP